MLSAISDIGGHFLRNAPAAVHKMADLWLRFCDVPRIILGRVRGDGEKVFKPAWSLGTLIIFSLRPTQTQRL